MTEHDTRERDALPKAARERLQPDRLEVLILARLSVVARKRPSASAVSKDLEPLLTTRLSPREWRESYERALAALRAQGCVEKDALALTDAGRARLARALGLDVVPRVRSWRELKAKVLPRAFLRAGTAGVVDVRVAVLAERLGVALEPKSTLSSLLDRWLAQELGLSGKVTAGKLRAALVARELGLRAQPTPAAVLRQGVTALAGATRGSADAVTNALTTRWVFGGSPGTGLPGKASPAKASPGPAASQPKPAASQPKPAVPGRVDDALLDRVVAQVLRASAGPSVRPYGPNKVFIASVWEALAFDPELRELGEPGFKALLVEAHRRGRLVLSRADLVAAMDPKDVAASETRHRNATYHFIVREGSA